jgi:outer membrane receptor protein involved in Fe transport
MSLNYLSPMKNVDRIFYKFDIENPKLSDTERRVLAQMLKWQGSMPFTGYVNFANDPSQKHGSLIMDARASYSFKTVTLAVIVKNIFNKEYTLRPMCIEPPRTFTFQINYNLN